MSLCTDLTVVNVGPHEGRIASLRCKRWNCPNCAPYCRRQVITKARDGNPTTFLTLTWNANRPETPDEAARVMKTAWVNLRRRIAKHWDIKNIPFIVVFEKTKAGYPHMHILLRAGFIPQAWLSAQMGDLIDAPVVDIRPINSRKMAFWYITKYLGKDPHAFTGCKRWWRSHNYEVETEEPFQTEMFGHRIEVVTSDYHKLSARYKAMAIDIIEENDLSIHFRWQHTNHRLPKHACSSSWTTSQRQSALADCGGIA